MNAATAFSIMANERERRLLDVTNTRRWKKHMERIEANAKKGYRCAFLDLDEYELVKIKLLGYSIELIHTRPGDDEYRVAWA